MRIGGRAGVEVDAIVTRDVPPNAAVVGNPARIVGYVDSARTAGASRPVAGEVLANHVPGVWMHRLRRSTDRRGSFVASDLASNLPFALKGALTIVDVPTRDVRGECAHRVCKQFLLCPGGSMPPAVDGGRHRQEVLHDKSDVGLFRWAVTWDSQFDSRAKAAMLVLASEAYDQGDYDYNELLPEFSTGPAK